MSEWLKRRVGDPSYVHALIERHAAGLPTEDLVDDEARKVLRSIRFKRAVEPWLRLFHFLLWQAKEMTYGRYRKARAKVRSSADAQPGTGAGGAPAVVTIPSPLGAVPTPPSVTGATVTLAGAGYASPLLAVAARIYSVEETFEDAGIRAGEVMGYRAWELRNGLLWSLVIADCCWKPGEAVEGNPGSAAYGNGVHAFKDRMEAYVYAYSCKNNDRIIVTGQVEMWGEVREHERGYRAEKARIVAIDDSPYYDAKALRKKYKVRKGR